MTQNDILTKGYQALIEALGVIGMIRFIQHFNEGNGDYTKERQEWLDSQNVEDVLAQMNQLKNIEDISVYYDNQN